MAVAGIEGKPLRLKDLLELDCDSCSAAGFRCYPRHLCVPAAAPLRARHNALHEAAEAPRGLGRSPSLRHPLLSIRTLSRRLRDGFSWRRREEEEEAAPVPAVSGGSSSSSSDSESSESGSSTERKSESDFSASSTESLHAGVTTGTACTREEDKEAMGRGSKEADDKEQLSPVAVMDFPFDDDYEDDAVEEEGRVGGTGACSTSFSDSLAQLHQRRNIQMHYKIRRRFGSVVEVGAVDLDESFAASDSDVLGNVLVQQPEYFCSDTGAATAPSCPEGHRSVDVCQDPDEHNLLGTVSAVCASERLLLDFFAETRRNRTSKNFEAAARMAEGWIQGTGARWGLKEVLCGREHLVAEMDRSQRWPARLGEVEEEREIGVVVAGLFIDELVADLVTDLFL
ncbi:unnamed protein product [Triticum turgidum subsp. durum]|uniref:DUF4378 domain-containing protein n=1 Tax=Triticum turgidum subsp. durum TaxID=4567 RepID=A0A9R0V722_TRITD|nr:unnamed protein product [Triticum turgidum subsp. durum]